MPGNNHYKYISMRIAEVSYKKFRFQGNFKRMSKNNYTVIEKSSLLIKIDKLFCTFLSNEQRSLTTAKSAGKRLTRETL